MWLLAIFCSVCGNQLKKYLWRLKLFPNSLPSIKCGRLLLDNWQTSTPSSSQFHSIFLFLLVFTISDFYVISLRVLLWIDWSWVWIPAEPFLFSFSFPKGTKNWIIIWWRRGRLLPTVQKKPTNFSIILEERYLIYFSFQHKQKIKEF